MSSEKGKRRNRRLEIVMTAVPVLITSKMLFVVFMVLGVIVSHAGYMVLALRNKRKTAAVMFLASMVMMPGMGYCPQRISPRHQ